MKVAKKKDEHLSKISAKPSTSVATGKGVGIFSTIDSSFCLTRSQLEQPSSINATQMYNGQPTSFTNLQSNSLNLDPNRAATLRRSNFLPYDGVLYEINDEKIEQDALWSYGNKTHLTYNEYLKEIRDQRRMQLQHIVVKQQTGKTFDYSRSPHRPLNDFFPALVLRRAPRVMLNIPVTLVVEDSSRSLFYTDADGYVQKLSGERCDDNVIQDMFKLSAPAAATRAVDDEDAPGTKIEQPVAVMKRSSGAQNELTLLDTVEFFKMMRDSSLGNAVIQEFIKPRGKHPAMYRTTWRRDNASSCVLISGHRPLGEGGIWHTSSTQIDSNTIISFRGIAATKTQRLLGGMVTHIEDYGPPCIFQEATGDFIKGADDVWYLLQMKCFVCAAPDRS